MRTGQLITYEIKLILKLSLCQFKKQIYIKTRALTISPFLMYYKILNWHLASSPSTYALKGISVKILNWHLASSPSTYALKSISVLPLFVITQKEPETGSRQCNLDNSPSAYDESELMTVRKKWEQRDQRTESAKKNQGNIIDARLTQD